MTRNFDKFIEAFERKDIDAIKNILGNESLDFSKKVMGPTGEEENYNLLEYILTNPPSEMNSAIRAIRDTISRRKEIKSAYDEYLELIEMDPGLKGKLSYYFETLDLLYKKLWSGDASLSDFNFNIFEHINEIVLSHMIKWLKEYYNLTNDEVEDFINKQRINELARVERTDFEGDSATAANDEVEDFINKQRINELARVERTDFEGDSATAANDLTARARQRPDYHEWEAENEADQGRHFAALRERFKEGAYAMTANGEVGVVLNDEKTQGDSANQVKLRLKNGQTSYHRVDTLREINDDEIAAHDQQGGLGGGNKKKSNKKRIKRKKTNKRIKRKKTNKRSKRKSKRKNNKR